MFNQKKKNLSLVNLIVSKLDKSGKISLNINKITQIKLFPFYTKALTLRLKTSYWFAYLLCEKSY